MKQNQDAGRQIPISSIVFIYTQVLS